MRRAPLHGLLCFALTSGCFASAPPPPAPPPPPAEAKAAVPAWVPAHTAQQLALLAPTKQPVQTPAERVFPDLERFGYANNRPLAGPGDAIRFTKMVATVLHDSPRLYSLGEAPPAAANRIGQYGPAPGEPDGYKVVRRHGDGIGELVAPSGAAEARAAATAAERLAGAGDLPGAIEAYRAAVTRNPGIPALAQGLGSALRRAGKLPDAEVAYRGAIAADPTFAPAHLALAELAERRHEVVGARREVIEALSYDPSSDKAMALARRLGAASFSGAPPGPPAVDDGGWIDRAPTMRVEPFAIFLDVDAAGAIHVAGGPGDAAQIYGGCRAIMRHEPDVRARIFNQPRETPYYLSVVEEVVCIEAGLGAYLAARGAQPKTPNDPSLEALYRVAETEGLSGYVMFEILGKHRPERARAAPPDVHRAIVGYLEHQVFGLQQAPRPNEAFAARQ